MRLKTLEFPNFGDRLTGFRAAVSGIEEPNLAVVRFCIEPALLTPSWVGLLPNNPLAIGPCRPCIPVAFAPFAVESPGCAANEGHAQKGEEWIEFHRWSSATSILDFSDGLAHPQFGELR